MQNIGFQEKTSLDIKCFSCELLGATLGILTSHLYKSPTKMFWKRSKLFCDLIWRCLEASEGFIINFKKKAEPKLTVVMWSLKFD